MLGSALMPSFWYEEPVLGALGPTEAAQKLKELGEDEAADELLSRAPQETESFGVSDWLRKNPKPWQHTAHSFGFVELAEPSRNSIPISHAGNIGGQDDLRGKRIRITLDQLRVAAYPGRGIHRILFDFYGQNQVQSDVEHLHFNTTYRVQEGEAAASV